MPHISVKMYPGRSEEQKTRLAEQIVKDVMTILDAGEEWISVAIEDVDPADWPEKSTAPKSSTIPSSTRNRATIRWSDFYFCRNGGRANYGLERWWSRHRGWHRAIAGTTPGNRSAAHREEGRTVG